jgi:hypothetical protein
LSRARLLSVRKTIGCDRIFGTLSLHTRDKRVVVVNE